MTAVPLSAPRSVRTVERGSRLSETGTTVDHSLISLVAPKGNVPTYTLERISSGILSAVLVGSGSHTGGIDVEVTCLKDKSGNCLAQTRCQLCGEAPLDMIGFGRRGNMPPYSGFPSTQSLHVSDLCSANSNRRHVCSQTYSGGGEIEW